MPGLRNWIMNHIFNLAAGKFNHPIDTWLHTGVGGGLSCEKELADGKLIAKWLLYPNWEIVHSASSGRPGCLLSSSVPRKEYFREELVMGFRIKLNPPNKKRIYSTLWCISQSSLGNWKWFASNECDFGKTWKYYHASMNALFMYILLMTITKIINQWCIQWLTAHPHPHPLGRQ